MLKSGIQVLLSWKKNVYLSVLLLRVEYITSESLLCRTGNPAQCSVWPRWKEVQREGIRVCMWLIHFPVSSDWQRCEAVQFSSVAHSCPTLCDPRNHSTPGLPVHHQLPEFTQTHAYRVGDTIQPSHPLSSPSPPAPKPSHHQGLFQWVNSSHQMAKVLEFQPQHQCFQWFRVDFL